MRKKLWGAVIGLSGLLLTGCTFGRLSGGQETAENSQTLQLKIALQNEEDHPLCQGMKRFGELLEEETGGRIRLELHFGGELGDAETMVSGMQSGVLDGGMLTSGVISGYGCEKMKVFALPYLFDSVEEARRFEKSEPGEALFDQVQTSGSRMICIGAYQEGARNYCFREKNVRVPEELKGLRIRCQDGEIYRSAVEALGAEAEFIPFSRLYSALQSGVVDGAEQPLSGFVLNHYGDVCRYYVMDQHEISPNLILFSEVSWNYLDEEDRERIRTAFEKSVPYFEELSDRQDETWLQMIRDSSVTVTEVNIRQWKEASSALYSRYEEEFGDVLKEIQKE